MKERIIAIFLKGFGSTPEKVVINKIGKLTSHTLGMFCVLFVVVVVV